MSLDNPKRHLTPDDVVHLLKSIDLGGPDDVLEVFVNAGTLRQLVTVWLRVAALLEGIEMNPGDHTDEEHCAVSILLTGECRHGSPDTHDTDPAIPVAKVVS